MRIITLEEHLSFPEMASQVPQEAIGNFGKSPRMQQLAPLLEDITGPRLDSMDRNGISMQVLSVDSAGANLLDEKQGPVFAARYNDLIAERIAGHRHRFNAFAHLPTAAPAAAADELERAVTTHQFCGAMIRGVTNDLFLDHPVFAPIFARAQQLNVPIYIHPGLPPKGVANIYYDNLAGNAGMVEALACYGWGWHAETALHLLRLFYAGIFDRYPGLKIIIGHMGEMLPMILTRTDRALSPGNGGANQRTLIDTIRQQVFITTSGFFTQPPFQLALDTIGINNLLFSVDYPFSTNEMGRAFLDSTGLAAEDLEKFTYGNAARVLGL